MRRPRWNAPTRARATLCQQVEETPRAVPCLDGAAHVLPAAGGAAHVVRDRGAASLAGAECREPRIPPGRASGAGDHALLPGRLRPGSGPPGTGSRAERLASAPVSRRPSTGRIPASCACPRWPEPCGRSDIPTMP